MTTVKLKTLSKAERLYVDDQLRMMSALDHKYLLKMYDVYYHETSASLLILRESTKISLDHLIEFYDGFDEVDAKRICHQMLSALSYLHRMDIVHGNLSANTIYMKHTSYELGESIQIKLMMSNHGKKGRDTFDLNGTGLSVVPSGIPSALRAPESQKQRTHSKAQDLWSVGMILHTMLGGTMPVVNRRDRLRKRERYGSMQSGHWQMISDDAKDLVQRLLTKDPTLRSTVEEALEHSWFVNQGEESD